MKGLIKAVVTLGLFALFLVACIVILSLGYFAAWLHTYNVFTDKRAVGEITISAKSSDEEGIFSTVKFTPINIPSALTEFLSPSTKISENKGETIELKVYGEIVHIGGPIIKFHNGLILLNFKTIYKVGEIYGRYLPEKSEIEAKSGSNFFINGAYPEWKELFGDISDKNLRGRIYDSIVDVWQISDAGKFVTDSEQKYTVYITNTGFVLDN